MRWLVTQDKDSKLTRNALLSVCCVGYHRHWSAAAAISSGASHSSSRIIAGLNEESTKMQCEVWLRHADERERDEPETVAQLLGPINNNTIFQSSEHLAISTVTERFGGRGQIELFMEGERSCRSAILFCKKNCPIKCSREKNNNKSRKKWEKLTACLLETYWNKPSEIIVSAHEVGSSLGCLSVRRDDGWYTLS